MESVDEFTIECLCYDSDEDAFLPIPYVNPNDFGNVTIKKYFTYQITTKSKGYVTAGITISKELYNFMEKDTIGRSLRFIFRRYAD